MQFLHSFLNVRIQTLSEFPAFIVTRANARLVERIDNVLCGSFQSNDYLKQIE